METNTGSFAEAELSVLSKVDPLSPLLKIKDEILALAERFGKLGSSGGSAPYEAGNMVLDFANEQSIPRVSDVTKAIRDLLLQKPICPITGIDEEWVDISDISKDDRMMYQNKRCSGLFKSKEGVCFYVDALIKKTPSGNTYYGAFWLRWDDYVEGDRNKKISGSQEIKEFPFSPKTFYIDVEEVEVEKDDWEMYVREISQLRKAAKYYNIKDFAGNNPLK